MIRTARAWLVMLTLTTTALAGCLSDGTDPTAASATDLGPDVTRLLPVAIANVMNFTQSVVSPAVGITNDLYEPTMEVSDSGTLYVAGHVIGAGTTGTPAYYSTDDGATWEPLPFLADVQTPPPGQGSQPPPGAEGFIVAGENGQAWMADIYLAGFSITGWCGDGATQCYDNRQAYDRVASTTQCNPVSLNDRPWAAYASGTLLLVNNPGGGPMQIGVMDVPPDTPVGIGGGAASLAGPTWNTCASEGGWIPGIPTMREDGLFAVPQIAYGPASGSVSLNEPYEEQVMTVVMGNKADIFDVDTKEVFPVTSTGGGTSNGGRTAFDGDGTLFVGARNNTEADEGRFVLAASTDDGQSFRSATFDVGTPVRSLYLDGNMNGPGALVTWSQLGNDDSRSDWYVAHVFAGPDGAPVLEHVTLAVDEGPHSSAHVMGAAAGPDGRAYFVNFASTESPADYPGSTPISVWIQQDGPVLPVAVPLVDATGE